jgi:hypothetical protein
VRTPPSEALEGGFEGRSGFWVEVRDEAGQPVQRELLHDPIRIGVYVALSEEAAASKGPRG